MTRRFSPSFAKAGPGSRPEVPFRLGLGERTVIRGTIDLLVERPGMPPLFVDYKTDRIEAGADPALPEAYELQRLLYAAAIAESTCAERVESAYCFLQATARPVRANQDGEAKAAGRAKLRSASPGSGPATSAPPPTPARPSAMTARREPASARTRRS